MPNAVVIPADKTQPCYSTTVTSLRDSQTIVGGYIEAVTLAGLATIYLNEEGKLEGLPPNRRATELWWEYEPGMRQRDYLAGNVFVIGPPDPDGDNTDIPDHLAERILNTPT